MKYTYLLFLLVILSCSSPKKEVDKNVVKEIDATESIESEVVEIDTVIVKDSLFKDTVVKIQGPILKFPFVQVDDTSIANKYLNKKTPIWQRETYDWGPYTFALGFDSISNEMRDEFSQKCYFLLIKDSVLIDQVAFTGYSHLYMEHFGAINTSTGFPIFSYYYGLEACDYPWGFFYFVLDTNNDKMIALDKIDRGTLDWHECVFPVDSNGIENKIIFNWFWYDDFDSKEFNSSKDYFSFEGDKFTKDKKK